MNANLVLFSLVTLLGVESVAGCHRSPPRERTPEGTLSLLRDSLATHAPPLDRVADTRIIAEATSLERARHLHETMGIPLTDRGFEMALLNERAAMDPTTFFRGVLPMLRQGHCVRIGDSDVPEFVRRVPEPGEHWPQGMLDMQVSVARRATNPIAGDYRCDEGPSFGVVFVRPYPDDGSYRVAFIGPSRHP